MISMDAPSYRFSLRSLFAVVTLFCLFFGYIGFELDWARQREHFLKADATTSFHRLGFGTIDSRPRGPFLTTLIGGTHYHFIEVPVQISGGDFANNRQRAVENHPDVKLAKKLFPEADIQPLVIPEPSADVVQGAIFHELLSSHKTFDNPTPPLGVLFLLMGLAVGLPSALSGMKSTKTPT